MSLPPPLINSQRRLKLQADTSQCQGPSPPCPRPRLSPPPPLPSNVALPPPSGGGTMCGGSSHSHGGGGRSRWRHCCIPCRPIAPRPSSSLLSPGGPPPNDPSLTDPLPPILSPPLPPFWTKNEWLNLHEREELLIMVLEGRGRRTTKAAVDGGTASLPRGWCAILTFAGVFKDFEGRGGGQIRVSMLLGVGGSSCRSVRSAKMRFCKIFS